MTAQSLSQDGSSLHSETTNDAASFASCEAHEPADATLEIRFEQRNEPWLLEIGSTHSALERLLRDGEALVLGSGKHADIRIDDRAVSKRHCRVWAERGRLYVEDLGSKNGVFVGGGRIQRAELAAGASFVVGRTVVACRGASDCEGLADDAKAEPWPGVIAGSLAMRRVIREIRKLAAVKAPVLFAGETGTGKDVLAKALHRSGPRRNQPFVALNVGALPRELAEAELFGHERGAFTGANVARDGAFVEAHRGTLFLDEIAELPLDLQVKLLRVLEDFQVRRIGGRGYREVDVRITSATWADLERRIRDGKFRLDLYQRLAVFVIEVPPLRDRSGDIVALAEKILRDVRDEVGPRELMPSAAARLLAYRWPGNVRELRNVVYRAALAASGGQIRASDIAASLSATKRTRKPPVSPEEARAYLERHPGNISAAARRLGVPRSTLRSWMKS